MHKWISAESPERKRTARRQAVSRVLAATESALAQTFATVPPLLLTLRCAPELAAPGKRPPPARDHTDIVEVYETTGRALLLLGNGGGGKSTLMTRLCVHLCREQAERDDPVVPVLVTPGAWRGGSFERWLVEAIVDAYPGVPPRKAAQWVAERAVVLLVDGLDEAGDERAGFLHELDRFLDAGPVPVVLSCRTDDFTGLAVPGAFTYAVRVVRPELDAARDYFRIVGTRAGDTAAEVSARDTKWWDLAREPLMLGVIAHLAATAPDEPVLVSGSAKRRRGHILGRYVDSMISRRGGPPKGWTAADARRWLAWLAWWMRSHDAHEFYVDRVPGNWLRDVLPYGLHRRPGLRVVVTAALLLGLGAGAVVTVLVAPILPEVTLLHLAPVLGMTVWSVRSNYLGTGDTIRLTWRVRWRWVTAVLAMMTSTVAVVLLLPGLLAELAVADSALLSGVALTLGNLPALLATTIEAEGRPNRAGAPPGARLRRSARVAWISALTIGPVIAVGRTALMVPTWGLAATAAYALTLAISAGACCWFVFGGFPTLQYRALFRAMAATGRGPRDYLAFLDWARSHLVLRVSGSAVRFPHREIRNHLADKWAPPGRPRVGRPGGVGQRSL
ncbi:hypothetical protein V5P93_003093 [Actinokineospora auranticolor]|uniref:NACHT domain-containing protein n=1 Tax=Actinokineospora auranticolor TaxID=155976 RepID=A0A2S6H168_9PSEU|nr:hypothetical protein [Actinokineospora auranticolor]PPK71228.1 hypothetical protein CLV40_101417 [Actinokineospora auranticolor]